MFSAPFGEHLVFKGGTSLSKAYGAIQRFSEDVDLTRDIRWIAPDLMKDQAPPSDELVGHLDPLPRSGSQEKRWTKEIRARLAQWVAGEARVAIETALTAEQVPATVRVHPEDPHALLVDYEAGSTGSGYVSPVVLLEFGARSTGEPCDERNVSCDAATYLPDLAFPSATPRVMRVERTFWEKATAIHVLCSGGKLRAERFSRHWYDLVQLDKAGYVNAALADRALALHVAEHKSRFFEEKADGTSIDYKVAVNGGLRLVPESPVLDALRDDYRKMVDEGLFLDEAESFDALLERCRQLQDHANAAALARAKG